MRPERIPYDFKSIEPKWQERWQERNLFQVHDSGDRPKFYYLDMFPYPSGNLHMGHMRNYVIGDVIARCMHMRGYNVLHPMGWDAFGLPAENAAIKNGVHPADWTRRCITNMRRQFDQVGISFDWDREVTTCDPAYYRWNQWIFLQMFKRGLAYRGGAGANWCPSCRTVLADEEVVAGGCNRCGSQVERRVMEQWFFAITKYADRLLDDIALLERWPDRVRVMQQNWIGRSTGVEFAFEIVGLPGEKLDVFTTRIDTIYGVDLHGPRARASARRASDRRASPRPPGRGYRRERHAARTSTGAPPPVPTKGGVFTGAYAVNPSPASASRSGSATTCLWNTGPARSWPSRPTTSATSSSPASTTSPSPSSSVPGRRACPAMPRSRPATATASMVNSGPFRRHCPAERGQGADRPTTSSSRASASARPTTASATGSSAASATGARRSPSSTATCAASCPCPRKTCRCFCPTCGLSRRRGGSPLENVPEFVNTTCPRLRRSGARARPTPWTTFVDSSWYFLRYASPQATPALRPRRGRLLAAGRQVRRRHRARHAPPALRPLHHQGPLRPRPHRLL